MNFQEFRDNYYRYKYECKAMPLEEIMGENLGVLYIYTNHREAYKPTELTMEDLRRDCVPYDCYGRREHEVKMLRDGYAKSQIEPLKKQEQNVLSPHKEELIKLILSNMRLLLSRPLIEHDSVSPLEELREREGKERLSCEDTCFVAQPKQPAAVQAWYGKEKTKK